VSQDTHTIARLREFIDDKLDFDAAMTVEEYIVEVDVDSDGVIVDCDENVLWPDSR